MNRIVIVCLLVVATLISFGQAPPLRPTLLNPKTVEAISTEEFRQLIAYHAAKGEQRGEVVLVNFWATWCAPCVKEVLNSSSSKRNIKRAVSSSSLFR